MYKYRKCKSQNKNQYEDYFRKQYIFKNNVDFKLPQAIFEFQRWTIPQLQELKKELNTVKSLLNKYDLSIWSKHTSFRDPSGSIIKKISETISPELLTQAWCKFYEILKKFPILPESAIQSKKINTLHLCEAPGAFVCALNHYLVTEHSEIQFNWMANTLNPNYEGNNLTQMIPDDRLIRYTMDKWNFGGDFTGDITHFCNHSAITSSLYCQEKVSVVIADGSIDCMRDPGEQEHIVEHLHFCETVTALAVLKQGGTFVLKIFTMFEDSTINLLYLLNCLFQQVTIFKPCTSKSGNSEVYVVSLNFKGFSLLDKFWHKIISIYKKGSHEYNLKSMFQLSDIPQQFLEQVGYCANFFMKNQIKTIKDNIYYFENKIFDNVQSKKWPIKKLFFQYYPISVIADENKIVPGINVGKSWRNHNAHCFKTDIRVVFRDNFLKNVNLNKILDIKIGRRIETVHNSKFASKDKLSVLQNNMHNKKDSISLYDQAYKMLCKENLVIDSKEFDASIYYKFQYSFFCRILTSLSEKPIILVNFPLLTHFLVGLLYILMHCYRKVIFWNGFIILLHADIAAVKIITNVLIGISHLCIQDGENNCDFEEDIIHLVSPSKFDEGYYNLVELIWNHNSLIFTQRERSSSLVQK